MPKCIDCNQTLKTETYHKTPWYICKCGNAMPESQYDELLNNIKQWKRSKISRIWTNRNYNM